MTVTAGTRYSGPYNGNGTTEQFAYTFEITSAADLEVVILKADGSEVVKTQTTHYSVNGVGEAAGGNVRFVSSEIPATGEKVFIRSDVQRTQEVDLDAAASVSAAQFEDMADKLTLMNADLFELLARCITLPVSDSGADVTLGTSATRRNSYIGFDDDGDLTLISTVTLGGLTVGGSAIDGRPLLSSTGLDARWDKMPITSLADTVTGRLLMRYSSGSGEWEAGTYSDFFNDVAGFSSGRKNGAKIFVGRWERATDPSASEDDAAGYPVGSQVWQTTSGAHFIHYSDGVWHQLPITASEIAATIAASAAAVSTIADEIVVAYRSTGQTITAAGTVTVSHGLGAEPDTVTAFLECISAEHGYSVGDRIVLAMPAAEGSDTGLSVVASATQLVVRYGSTANFLVYLHATTGAHVNLTPASWDLVLKATLVK